MGLLTKDERQDLSRQERRALRRERRDERRAERGDGVGLNLAALRAKASALILDWAGEAVPGPERMDAVLDELADDADSFLVWTWAGPAAPILELADGPAIAALVRLLVRPYVQRLHDELRELGALREE